MKNENPAFIEVDLEPRAKRRINKTKSLVKVY